MDNGLKGLLQAERVKLMQQVAAIDAVLGQATVGAASNANGNGHHPKNGTTKTRKNAVGVSATALDILRSEARSFVLADVAQRLKARGVYSPTISNRKLTNRTMSALYGLQYAGKVKRSDDGTWAAL